MSTLTSSLIHFFFLTNKEKKNILFKRLHKINKNKIKRFFRKGLGNVKLNFLPRFKLTLLSPFLQKEDLASDFCFCSSKNSFSFYSPSPHLPILFKPICYCRDLDTNTRELHLCSTVCAVRKQQIFNFISFFLIVYDRYSTFSSRGFLFLFSLLFLYKQKSAVIVRQAGNWQRKMPRPLFA